MSAECGSDIVYPEGTWPVGECPRCTRDQRIADLERAVEFIAEKIEAGDYGAALARSLAVSPADTTEAG